MGYGIIRVQKVKAPAVGSMQYHNDRVPGQHSNEDIDYGKSNLNKEYIEHGSYRAEVNDRIERFRESTRKVRKDAVVLAEGVATASPEFFEGKSCDEVMAYFDDVFEFCKAEFGEQNLVHFTVHMDETTPHAHFGFTPIKDGTLSWKNYFDGRDALRGFQNRYWERVGKSWGLERGETGSGRTHKTTQEMKREAEREIKELDKRKECLRQRTEAEAAEVAGLDRAIAEAELQPARQTLGESARTLFKARGDADREGSLGSEIEGLRSRIGELEQANHGARERVAELDRKLPGLRDRCERARARFEGVELRVREAVGRLREVPNTLSEWALGIANRLGKRMYDPNSLDHLMRQARDASRALEHGREAPRRNHGRNDSAR